LAIVNKIETGFDDGWIGAVQETNESYHASSPKQRACYQVIIDEFIKIVETAGRNPGKYFTMFKAAGS